MSADCSGGVSKAWKLFTGKRAPFEHCCDQHDRAYRTGGSERARKRADGSLEACVRTSGYPILASFMYYAVRWFGWIYWGR